MRYSKYFLLFFFAAIYIITLACTSPGKIKQQTSNNQDMGDKENGDSTMLDMLKSADNKQFIGKPVDSLLNSKVFAKYKEAIFIDKKPGMLTHLNLRYAENVFVELNVNGYKHMKPFNEDRKWNLDLFRKEVLSEIKIYQGSRCLEVIK